MTNIASIRGIYLIGLLASAFLLTASIYFQIFEGFVPCPLCILQRATFGILSILFLLGLVLSDKVARLLINLSASLISILGIALAGRQIWLQHFPPTDGTECSVSIEYMMQVLPFHEVIKHIVAGGAECSQRGFEFLTLNMAEWSLLSFIAIFILVIYLLRKCMDASKTVRRR